MDFYQMAGNRDNRSLHNYVLEMMQKRRSVRNYTGETIPEEKLTAVLQAGLLSPSSRSIRPWELIAVSNKEMLEQMSKCRTGPSKMLQNAGAAIVVIANAKLSDVWIEDCSIVMANMHLLADSIGLGSCWIQGRLREAFDGRTTETYLRQLLGYPEDYCLEAILSLGIPENHPAMQELSSLPVNKIHMEKF